jgi:hypothetical protein
MTSVDRDHSLETLLNLDGQVFYIGDKGHRVQFEVTKIKPTAERPHGLRYSLTVHDPRGKRIAGFDNAHAVASTDGPGGKRVEHDHKHRFQTVRPYEYTDAVALMEDFWRVAESVLKEEGVKI